MGVEGIRVDATGGALPTLGARVALGLSPMQKAKLKGVNFMFGTLSGGTVRTSFGLSEDLRFLDVGPAVFVGQARGFFAVVRHTTVQNTAVGVVEAWHNIVIPLWDYEVYQDIVFVPGVQVDDFHVDLYYEKVRITQLEKATHLHQLERHFAVA